MEFTSVTGTLLNLLPARRKTLAQQSFLQRNSQSTLSPARTEGKINNNKLSELSIQYLEVYFAEECFSFKQKTVFYIDDSKSFIYQVIFMNNVLELCVIF